MNLITKNVIANLLGNGWIAMISILFIPVYIRFIGMEAYGLLGFYSILVALFSIFDFGLSTTMNREMARFKTQVGIEQQRIDLVRTLEVIYWLIGGIVCFAIILFSKEIATRWISGVQFSLSEIQFSVLIMGVVIAAQWPLEFYSGGLIGLEEQIQLNIIRSGMATFKNGGAAFILWAISPTIYAFFIWQIIGNSLEVMLLAFSLWRKIKYYNKPKINFHLLKNVRRFATGMSGITLVTFLLTNADKIILSKMLSLEILGFYTLAFSVSGIILKITTPIFTAVFPRFTQLAVTGDRAALTSQYHLASQMVSVIIIPVGLFISVFSTPILQIWINDPNIVQNTSILLKILALGTILNGLMYVPYAMELAQGWTKLAFYKNLVALVVFIPLLILMIDRYEAIGAASLWILLNCFYIMFEPILVHRRFLAGKVSEWYLRDVGLPLISALIVLLLGYGIINPNISQLKLIVSLGFVLLFAIISSILSAYRIRQWFLRMVLNYESM